MIIGLITASSSMRIPSSFLLLHSAQASEGNTNEWYDITQNAYVSDNYYISTTITTVSGTPTMSTNCEGAVAQWSEQMVNENPNG
ncbi:MAG: hypothetical protein ABSE82_15800, partial [Nitrososphaerales archaeon]